MPFPIEEKLVIAVASSALFDLSDSHSVYEQQGIGAYQAYQEEKRTTPFPKGVAFPFIRRFLRLNQAFPNEAPVEVVLLSRNSPETGLRIFNSIEHYGLGITRAAFMAGQSPHAYIPAFNASLFLSSNEPDVQLAIDADYPAGVVLPSLVYDDEQDTELRLAFDFDGVIADDESETVFKTTQSLDSFAEHETARKAVPHQPGPLGDLFRKLAVLRGLEQARLEVDPGYCRILKTSIVTARSAPSHERVITTLKSWGVSADEVFFLGGMEKSRVLSILRPHMFFDDQRSHLVSPAGDIPMVHIPFGIANNDN